MAEERYLIDSNILIRWVKPEDSRFDLVDKSLRALDLLGVLACYTSQNLGEFWNVLTRPFDRNGYGLTAKEANIRATDVEATFRLLPDGPAVHQEWRRLLIDYRVCGVQVHDARLVASMHVHGVRRILTFNTKDFARLEDIEAIHPAQLI